MSHSAFGPRIRQPDDSSGSAAPRGGAVIGGLAAAARATCSRWSCHRSVSPPRYPKSILAEGVVSKLPLVINGHQ